MSPTRRAFAFGLLCGGISASLLFLFFVGLPPVELEEPAANRPLRGASEQVALRRELRALRQDLRSLRQSWIAPAERGGEVAPAASHPRAPTPLTAPLRPAVEFVEEQPTADTGAESDGPGPTRPPTGGLQLPASGGTFVSARVLLSALDGASQRREVLEALSGYALEDVPEARAALLRAYRETSAPYEKALVLYQLQLSFPDPEVRDLAREAVRTSSDSTLLIQAANTLAVFGDVASIDLLREASARTAWRQARWQLQAAADQLQQQAASAPGE